MKTMHHRRTGGVLLAAIVMLASCSGGDADDDASSSTEAHRDGSTSAATDSTGEATVGVAGELTIEVAVDLDAPGTAIELGQPVSVTVTVTNSGERSAAAPVDLTLIAPDGNEVAFYRTSMFAPFGDEVSESVDVTTSRWFGTTGEFGVRADLTDPENLGTPGLASFTVAPTDRTIPVFEDVTAQAGVITEVPVPGCGQFSNGAGWADVDGDGWQDLVVTRLGDPVQLFINHGDGTFGDESAERGVAFAGANGVGIADYDNDGDPDLMLVADGADALLRNDGSGRFEDVTTEAGVAGDGAARGMSAAWGDFDGDGLLDLYVTNYMECTGAWDTEAEIVSNVAYHDDVLYRNEGDGSFSDVTDWLPDSDRTAAGFTAAWVDVNNDGLLDLYVANDFVGISPDSNRLWINGGPSADGWTFTDASLESGAGLYMNTMGVGVGDVDRDGVLDMALSNIGGNKLLRGLGPGTFVERQASGIERPMQGIDYPTITWASAFHDFDLDGWEDLFMAAGNLQQAQDAVVGDQPNSLFVNDGTGETFLDVSALTGADEVDESKGAAFADYDNDGSIDVFVINQAGAPRLYRNVTDVAGRHWLQIELTGTSSNRDGCGARIAVHAGIDTIYRTVLCGSGGSGSTSQHAVHIGLGTADAIDSIDITWPSGTEQTLEAVTVDQLLEITEPST